MSPNKRAVKEYMDAYNELDHERILGCLTDDVEWLVPGAFHRVGKVAFDEEIENDAFTGKPTIRVTRMTEEDDVVIAEGTVRCAFSAGGFLNAAFCDVFEMTNAKIRMLTSYVSQVGEQEAVPAGGSHATP